MTDEKMITLELQATAATRLLEALETPEPEQTMIHREMIRALREQITKQLHDV